MSLLSAAIFILFVSFVSNVSPFFGASYTLFTVLQLSLLGVSPVNFVVLVIVSATGAALAKVVIYYGAFGFRGFLTKNKNVRLIGRESSRSEFYLVLFVTALLPVLPLDDFIYIGAGATKAPIVLMTVITLASKTVKSGFEIALELTVLRDLGGFLGITLLGSIDATIVLSLGFVVLGIGLYRLDWEKWFHKVWPVKVAPEIGQA